MARSVVGRAAGRWSALSAVVVGLDPSVAVSTGVVIPLPRTEYRYGVFGNKPMSVKLRPLTVAIR